MFMQVYKAHEQIEVVRQNMNYSVVIIIIIFYFFFVFRELK